MLRGRRALVDRPAVILIRVVRDNAVSPCVVRDGVELSSFAMATALAMLPLVPSGFGRTVPTLHGVGCGVPEPFTDTVGARGGLRPCGTTNSGSGHARHWTHDNVTSRVVNGWQNNIVGGVRCRRTEFPSVGNRRVFYFGALRTRFVIVDSLRPARVRIRHPFELDFIPAAECSPEFLGFRI
jgi:hypothetical protein